MRQPPLIEDHHRSGFAMPQVQVHLPLEALQRPQRQAGRFRCSQSGLTRTMTLWGLVEMEQPLPPSGGELGG